MKKNNFWDSISIFETGLSATEWLWRIVTILFIGSSGTVTAFLAKADPLLKQLGPIYWIYVGLIVSFVIAIIFYLIKSAILKQAQADFNRAMSIPKTSINPLLDSFQMQSSLLKI